jgi:cytochrome b6-f complex iron-sulfur subunit
MINERSSIEQNKYEGEGRLEVRNVTRRDVLKVTWAGLGALATAEIGGLALAYTQPRLVEGEFGSLINVGAVDDFPPGSVTHVPNGRFYLSRLQDGGFLAIYQRCTHLGCSVPWVQEQEAFVCPCHNSQFTAEGEVLNPPASSPLNLFPITIDNGSVLVNTGAPITRNEFDVTQVVYA